MEQTREGRAQALASVRDTGVTQVSDSVEPQEAHIVPEIKT